MLLQDKKQQVLDLINKACSDAGCTLLYACITGSQAYGNAIEGSDIDARFVFAAPPKHYLGFTKKAFIDVSNNDIAGYEFIKWAELLLSNNPTVMEMLFMEPESILFIHSDLLPLFDAKKTLLSKKCFHTYLKYAENQVYKAKSCTKEVVDELEWFETILTTNNVPLDGKSIKQIVREKLILENGSPLFHDCELCGESGEPSPTTIGCFLDEYVSFKQKKFPYSDLGQKRREYLKLHGYDTKNFSHAVRLSRTCRDIFEKKELRVKRDDAKYFLDIKHGKYKLEDLEQEFIKLRDKIQQLFEVSDLPEEPDRDKLENMCVRILENVLFSDQRAM